MGGHTLTQRPGCPSEILGLIFEDLHRTDPVSLRAVRLASRRFHVLVNPIAYRHLKLNKAIVKCFDVFYHEPGVLLEVVDARREVRRAICTYTRQVTIDRALDWPSVVGILSSLGQFHQLNWHFWETETVSAHSRLNQGLRSISGCLAERWPSAKLSVDKLSLMSGSVKEFMALPPTNLVSVQLQGLFRRYPSQYDLSQIDRTLKAFLLQCDQLTVLHLVHLGSGNRFLEEEIEQSERLPPVGQLYLRNYIWLHSPSIANSFWNWSRLTSLRLEKVNIIQFLESVLPENLRQLRSLITDGHCERPMDRPKTNNLMIKLVRAIDKLEILSLICLVEMFPLDAIRKHGPALRQLQLREYTRVVQLPLRQGRIPTLSLHALLEIQSCPRLMELALDLDQGMVSSSFTSLLLECRNLRRLTMFVQQPFFSGIDLNNEQGICSHIAQNHPFEVESIEVGAASNYVDRTYEAVCTFLQGLLLRKQGAAFEKLTMHIAGQCDGVYPEVLSVEGQRLQLSGTSHGRTFVYEPKHVNGLPTTSFHKQLVQETTTTKVVAMVSSRAAQM